MEYVKRGEERFHSFAPLEARGRAALTASEKRKAWPTAMKLNFNLWTTRQLFRSLVTKRHKVFCDIYISSR
jgi:hypothetical protein